MNKKQKTVVAVSLAFLLVSLIVWISFGSEIFTKTQVLVEKKDELFGWTEKQWVNKFVLGLDYILAADFTLLAASAFLLFKFRSKR